MNLFKSSFFLCFLLFDVSRGQHNDLDVRRRQHNDLDVSRGHYRDLDVNSKQVHDLVNGAVIQLSEQNPFAIINLVEIMNATAEEKMMHTFINLFFVIDNNGEQEICQAELWLRNWRNVDREYIIKCQPRSTNGWEAKKQTRRQLLEKFKSFREKYKKNYSTPEEFEHRFNVFVKNLKVIEDMQNNEKGSALYGVTKFADITPAEFKGMLTSHPAKSVENMQYGGLSKRSAPRTWDWRLKKVVTPVRDQGPCMASWAFAAASSIESRWAIRKGSRDPWIVSPQQMLDCDHKSKGCLGGSLMGAYESVIAQGGIMPEDRYPYLTSNASCDVDPSNIAVLVVGAMEINVTEEMLKEDVYNSGPIAVTFNGEAMQFYMSGVAAPSKCPASELNHSATIIGYGIENKELSLFYWLLKASWGTDWGEEGYYKLVRNQRACGIGLLATHVEVI